MAQPNAIRSSTIPGLAVGDVSNTNTLPSPSPARGQAVDAGGGLPIPISTGVGAPNTQVGDYTLVLTDTGLSVEINAATTKTVTIPPNSQVAFAIGTIIEVCRLGTGAVNIAAGAGVTIRSRSNLLGIANRYSTVSLRQRATDEWVLVGDLA